jgi:hypothetical protein
MWIFLLYSKFILFIFNFFVVYFFGGLECVGPSFGYVYVAHFVILRDVLICNIFREPLFSMVFFQKSTGRAHPAK